MALDPLGIDEMERERPGVLVDGAFLCRVSFVFFIACTGGVVANSLIQEAQYSYQIAGVMVGAGLGLCLLTVLKVWKTYICDGLVVYSSLPPNLSYMV